MENQGVLFMGFGETLGKLRKAKSLTQQALAERVGVHTIQIHRYESGTSQPTLVVIKNIALSLGVTTDELIFEKNERGPDEELRLQFEAISQFPPEEKATVKEVLEGLILKHEARRWAAS